MKDLYHSRDKPTKEDLDSMTKEINRKTTPTTLADELAKIDKHIETAGKFAEGSVNDLQRLGWENYKWAMETQKRYILLGYKLGLKVALESARMWKRGHEIEGDIMREIDRISGVQNEP